MGALDAEQLERYARHVVLEDVGPEGQAALCDADVLVVGAGGLGSPVLQYLAAAGVGTLAVADHDAVERSNLQRQVLHADADVGRPKVESARDHLAALNPDVTVEARETRVDAENVAALLDGRDLVVDATDDVPTRLLLNDAAALAGVPLVYGAVYRFEGQVAAFLPDQGPCYRCLFPAAPPADAVPDCAEAGVLGAVPGVVGSMQAAAALNCLLDRDPPVGRLLSVDLAGFDVETVAVNRREGCPVCEGRLDGLDPAVYEGDCSLPSDPSP